jgi:hypothetical protein
MSGVAIRVGSLAAGLVALLAVAAAARAGPPRVTVIGDSVQESLRFAPHAQAVLGSGIDLRLEAAACRRLTGPGCIGGRPENALSLVRRSGSSLGRVAVVNVGYNDGYGTYGVARVQSALRAAGVRRTVWVTLRETQGTYAAINDEIRVAAAARGSRIRVADWSAASAGRPWFGRDGVHLTAAGAEGLAAFLHRRVVAALAEVGIPVSGSPPPVIASGLRAPYPLGGIAGDGRTLWAYGGERLSAIDEGAPRGRAATASVGPAGTMTPDGGGGGGLWVRNARGDLMRAAAGRPGLLGASVAHVGPGAVAVRTGSRTWIAAPRHTSPLRPYPQPQLFDAHGAAAPRQPERAPIALAAGGGTLWALVPDGEAARLERRDAATGRLQRASRVRPGRRLVATRDAAWLVEAGGRLRRIGADGSRRAVLRRIRAVASDGGGRLWALRTDGRTLLRLRPSDGRVLTLGRSRHRVSRLALTDGYLWLAAPGTVRLERVRAYT